MVPCGVRLSTSKSLLRRQAAVSLDFSLMENNSEMRVVIKMPPEILHESIHLQVLVHGQIIISSASPPHHPGLPIRILSGASNPCAVIIVPPGDTVGRHIASIVFKDPQNLVAQILRDPFIRINNQDPISSRPLHRKILLRSEAGPWPDDDAGPRCSRQLRRLVRALGIDDKYFIDPGKALHACLNVSLLVLRDDAGGHGRPRFSLESHVAAPHGKNARWATDR